MIATTVIGSYPCALDGAEYARLYFENMPSFANQRSMKDAVDDMVGAGIDIVSDGQTKSDFITLFAGCFSNVVMQEHPVVIGEIEYVGPKTLDDQETVRGMIPKNKSLKGIVTGPYTLAKSSKDMHYRDLEKLSFEYARGLALEIEAISGVCDYVQIDEPFFAYDLPPYAGELVSNVLSKAGVPRMLHVCGDVSESFPAFIEFDVDFLEHEFAASPNIWDVAGDLDFGQTLGVGVVRSDMNSVESVREILSRMEFAVRMRDAKKLIFNPDCGLRNLDVCVARSKLENLVLARDILCERDGI